MSLRRCCARLPLLRHDPTFRTDRLASDLNPCPFEELRLTRLTFAGFSAMFPWDFCDWSAAVTVQETLPLQRFSEVSVLHARVRGGWGPEGGHGWRVIITSMLDSARGSSASANRIHNLESTMICCAGMRGLMRIPIVALDVC